MMTLVRYPVGPKTKYPCDCPMAALAWSAYCCGDSPVRFCTLSTLITVLAGTGGRPGATTLLRRSTPINGAAGLSGQGMRPAVTCASVRLPIRLFEKQPPGSPLSKAILDTNDGDP